MQDYQDWSLFIIIGICIALCIPYTPMKVKEKFSLWVEICQYFMTNHKCYFCNRWPEKLNSELSSGWWRSKMRGHEREHLWERSGIFIFVSDDHQGPSNLHQSEGWCSETMVVRQFGWRPHYLYSAHSWSVSRFWDDEKCSRYWTEDCGSENRRWEKFRWSRPGILPDRIL